MPFLNSIFFENLQGVTLWLLNYCFRGKKCRGQIYFKKIVLTDINLNFQRALTRTFDRADRITERGISKTGFFQVLCDFFHELNFSQVCEESTCWALAKHGKNADFAQKSDSARGSGFHTFQNLLKKGP